MTRLVFAKKVLFAQLVGSTGYRAEEIPGQAGDEDRAAGDEERGMRGAFSCTGGLPTPSPGGSDDFRLRINDCCKSSGALTCPGGYRRAAKRVRWGG